MLIIQLAIPWSGSTADMKIDKITLSNFRCFGPEACTIRLNEITAFIGSNGCGKTAVLQALARLFSFSSSDRRIQRSDFYVPVGETLDSVSERSLFIEAWLSFPELTRGEVSEAVPDCFQHMVVEEDGSLFCRVRLEANWIRSDNPEGYLDERIYWVRSASTVVGDTDKSRMQSFDRSKIHVHYIPSSRDPAQQLKYVSGSMLRRLLEGVDLSPKFRNSILDISKQLAAHVKEEAGIQVIHEIVEENWKHLHEGPFHTKPRLRIAGTALSEIFEQVGVIFQPTEDGEPHDVSRLSDGQKGLFYLALISSIYEVRRRGSQRDQTSIAPEGEEALTFMQGSYAYERVPTPSFTIFAIEEPENHLAPQFLGRILRLLKRIAESEAAQVVIASHSPAIVGRIGPEDLRHIRLEGIQRKPIVSEIRLPAAQSDAYKYVREAVRAYPELY